MKFDLLLLFMRWIRWLGRLFRLLCSVAFGMHAWAGVFCSQLLVAQAYRKRFLRHDGRFSRYILFQCENNFHRRLLLPTITPSRFR